MAGNGTIALELLEDLAELDAVVVPWGGGGLSCGIASVLRQKAPHVKIYAAEVDTGAPLSASLAAGEPRTVEHTPSFVDGISSRAVFSAMFAQARDLLDGSIVVTLDEAGQAMKLVAERNRVIMEGRVRLRRGGGPFGAGREREGGGDSSPAATSISTNSRGSSPERPD
jgi:threonine dehydratase